MSYFGINNEIIKILNKEGDIMLTCLAYLFVFALIIFLIQTLWPIVLLAGLAYGGYRLYLYIKKERYFKSEEFLNQKEKLTSTINEYNEMADYVKEIPAENTFKSSDEKGEFAHLAKYENTSNHNYKRNKNTTNLNKDNVYSTSLAVVKRASEDPIKYVTKYFGMKPTEENLEQIEQIGENIYRLENTVENLDLRIKKLKNDFNPPKFILKHFEKELMEKLDVHIPEINIEYTDYIFEYVSPGGNSSQRATITLNGETIETIAVYLDEKIKYKKSAKAQRALMTNKLRTEIKERDDYTCQSCGTSVYDQSLLLLEIDHIIPVSKGGLSTRNNLQTLCWKCNRSKSDKVMNIKTV